MGHRNRYEGEIDRQVPAPFRNRWSGSAGSVDVEFCCRGPLPSASRFGKGHDTHVSSSEGSEGRRLERGVIDPCTNGNGCKGVTVGTMYGRASSALVCGTDPSFGLPERDDVLTNSAVGIPVLSWVVCYAAHKICRLHVNCGSVGQIYQCWRVLRVPECGAGAVDGERPTVVGSSVCTVDSDGPAGLGDGSSHDGRGRRGRRDRSERNAIIGRTAFGGELSLAGR